MMKKELIECIPNISYGLNDNMLHSIVQNLNKIQGQKLIHMDSNEGANRTVLTLVGNRTGIRNALLSLFQITSQNIDMRKHQGAHPRIGMVDVCPIVPLQGISLKETLDFTRSLSQEIAEQFNIPIYSYEHSQDQSYRKHLPQIRKGGYEGLIEKMKKPEWNPDFGPLPDSEENILAIQKYGATVLGVRPILIAYNVSIKTDNTKIAQQLAHEIRSIGDGKGNRGAFEALRAIGWYIPEFEHAQISMNFLNYKITSPLEVYDNLKEKCKSLNIEVIGSELVGLIPQEVIVKAGEKMAKKLDRTELNTDQLIPLGIDYLQLNAIKPFNPELHILEKVIKNVMNIELSL